MATIINASINLSKISKEKIFKGKQGKYYNLDIIVNDEPNQYGKNVSIADTQTKEQRQAKEKRIYIGEGKTVWTSQPNVPPQTTTPFTDEMDKINQKAELTLKNDYMNWIKINTANLPEGEVLAANFKAGTYGYTEKLLGYLHMDDEKYCCENDNEVLENCTHYIDINKHDIKEVD